jgi:hypothetical protein
MENVGIYIWPLGIYVLGSFRMYVRIISIRYTCIYVLWPFGIHICIMDIWYTYMYYGHLVYIYVLWPLGNLVAIWYIFPVLVYCVKKSGNPDYFSLSPSSGTLTAVVTH